MSDFTLDEREELNLLRTEVAAWRTEFSFYTQVVCAKSREHETAAVQAWGPKRDELQKAREATDAFDRKMKRQVKSRENTLAIIELGKAYRNDKAVT